jgi:plasmid stabilization system protein ParE
MAQVIWTEPALTDLDAIADYIALDNPGAANRLVQKVFEHIDQWNGTPKTGPSLANSVVAATAKLSGPPAGSSIASTGKGVGSST